MDPQINLIEELAANAWAPAFVQHVDGWRLRYSYGMTRRANSVLPIADGGRYSLADKTQMAEQFYADRDMPCRFQIADLCAPAGLDDYLAGRGYTDEAHTMVLTAPLATVLAGGDQAPHVAVTDTATQEWTRVYEQANDLRAQDAELQRDIMGRIPVAALYALACVDGEPAAVGWAAVERGWVGVYGMTTRLEFRRQGAARATLHALATHAAIAGASDVYLQVMVGNDAARRLYEGAGLRPMYSHHYRTLPGPESPQP